MGFVKSYIQLFAYSSVTTEEWKNYLFTYFKDKVRKSSRLNWILLFGLQKFDVLVKSIHKV